MKTYLPFPLILLSQLICIWMVPNLAINLRDQFSLSIISIVFCIIFVLGTQRIITALKVSQSRFNAKYFGAMGLRMAIGLILIAIYLKNSGVINKPASIFLICSYFVYMGFEIRIILHKLRSDSQKSKNADNAQK